MGDLDEVDDEVKLNVEFVFAETLQDVLDTALVQRKKSLSESAVPLELLSGKRGKSSRVKTTV